MSTRVFRYGLLAPTENAELVRAQMREAHNYRNKLVALERTRRDGLRAAQLTVGDVAALEAAVRAAEDELRARLADVKTARAASRSRSETAEARAAVTAARTELRLKRAAFGEARRKLREDPTIIARMAEINDQTHAAQIQARTEVRTTGGIYWGTYLLIEAARDASVKELKSLYDGTRPNDPHFVRWEGEGRIGVQIQKGIPVPKLADSTMLRVDPVDPAAWTAASRGVRRRLSRTRVHLRVGSDAQDPIWATWPMIMHRPLPEDGVIKGAVVVLRRYGPREEWSLHVTVESTTSAVVSTNQEAVAVDVGWRVRGDENAPIRVAFWRGTDGKSGELALPPEIISGLAKADELRATRDTNFNAARDALALWLRTAVGVPAWFTEASAHLGQWRSPARLAALVKRWRTQRWDGDAEGYTAAEAWRYHDFHLWGWETGQRRRTLARRKDFYRNVAATFARSYGTVILEKFDKRDTARRKKTESHEIENETARTNRVIAAVSELCGAFVNAFRKTGTVVEIPAAYTTRQCHACGAMTAFDQAEYLHHRCRSCKTLWDQDDNAAHNLLLRWREQLGGGTGQATARVVENTNTIKAVTDSRWARAKARKVQVQIERAAARKTPDTDAE